MSEKIRVTVEVGSDMYVGDLPRYVGETPEPAPKDSFLPRGTFFPDGPGWFNYPGDKAWPWLQEHGYTWGQFWSGAYVDWLRPWPLGTVPYTYEIQTIAGRQWDWPGSETLERRIKLHSQSAGCLGATLNCEVPWRSETEAVYGMLKAAGLSVIGGNLVNDPDKYLPRGEGWGILDAGITWVNPWRWDRMWRDVFYAIAEMPRTGIPWALSVQPCVTEGNPTDGTPIILAPSADFRKALQVATDYADGVMLWKVEQLWMADEGQLAFKGPGSHADSDTRGGIYSSSDTLGRILDAVKTVKPRPRTMPELPVYFRAVNAESFNWSRFLCRVVSRAGFVPVNQEDRAVARLDPAILIAMFSAEDTHVYNRFHQYKHRDRDGTERGQLIEIENRLAEWVAAEFGGTE